MLNIPYISSPKNACALACYTMTSKYYFPDTSFEQIAEISNWKSGFVVWPFKFWKWIMDKGIKITDFDLIDYVGWAEKGSTALKNSLSEKEFDWLVKNSTDLNEIGKDVKNVLSHKNFTYIKEKPTFEILEKEIGNDNVCEVVLDSRTLDKREGFSLHRVVVTSIEGDNITFHDPRENPMPNRKETVSHFKKPWLKAVSDPELCIYSENS